MKYSIQGYESDYLIKWILVLYILYSGWHYDTSQYKEINSLLYSNSVINTG